MVNIIKGGTNISPLLSAIVLSGLRLTAQKKILIKDTSYNTIVKLPKNVIKSIKPINAKPAKPTKAKPAKPTKAKPAKPTKAKPAKPTNAKPAKPTNAKPTKPTNAKPAKPTNAKPLKRKFKGGGAAEFFE